MSVKYVVRLDDYCNTSNKKKWNRIERLLDHFNIKPIIAVIPDNKDKTLFIDIENKDFWQDVKIKEKKGWNIAQHGYQHLYTSKNSGIMKLNNYSEFSGLEYQDQYQKIKKGYDLFLNNEIKPKIFVAPAHSFDWNTLKAIKEATEIRVISDGFSIYPYKKDNFLYIPQQIWNFRKFAFGTWTVCLHPDFMKEKQFEKIGYFLEKYNKYFLDPKEFLDSSRKKNILDSTFDISYRFLRGLKNVIK